MARYDGNGRTVFVTGAARRIGAEPGCPGDVRLGAAAITVKA